MSAKKTTWWYWLCGIGIFQQAVLLAGIAWYLYPKGPPPEFFMSLKMLSVLVITSAAIVFLVAIPLIKCSMRNDGIVLFGAGLGTWFLTHYFGLPSGGWMVEIMFLTFAVWGVIIGALILFREAWYALW